MDKVLMYYYSFEGNMTSVAELVKKHSPKAAVEQLIADKEPPKHGIGKFLLGGRSAIFKENPHLQPLKSSPDEYQKIIIGFPVWAGTYPPAIGSLLDKVNFTGKDLYVIACSASGKAEKAISNIRNKLADCTVKGSLSLVSPLKHPESAEKQVSMFLKEYELI